MLRSKPGTTRKLNHDNQRGSEQDRGAAQVYVKKDEDGLWLRTAYPRGGNSKSDVVYQIKLPRELDAVDLNTVNGSIKLSGISAAITAQTVNGLVDLANVAGVKKVQSTNGNIKAIVNKAGSDSMNSRTQREYRRADQRRSGDDLEAPRCAVS